jgi:hypothetical protein
LTRIPYANRTHFAGKRYSLRAQWPLIESTAEGGTSGNIISAERFPSLFGLYSGTSGSASGFFLDLTTEDTRMKYAIILATVAAFATPALAEEVGVHVGPVGAGVTVGEGHRDYDRDRDRDRTTVIRESEPREHTTIIKKEREEPSNRVIIKDRD